MSSEELTPAANCQPSTAILKLNNTTAVTPTTSTELNLYKKSSSNSLFYSTLGGGEVELGSGGGLVGPGSSTDNAVVRWNGTDATAVQNSTVTLSDVGVFNTLSSAGVVNATTQYNMGGDRVLSSDVSNVCLGYRAGNISSGSNNVVIGPYAGFNLSTGTSNVLIGQNTAGSSTGETNCVVVGRGCGLPGSTANECIVLGTNISASLDNQIRIGINTTHTTCYIGGISGRTTIIDDAVPVLISSGGQLGTTSSSLRYKTDVQDMKDYSSGIYDLRPVTFKWKPEHNPSTKIQVGLIAEEVAETFPSLAVIKDDQPETVAYQNLVPLLLNEVQKLKLQVTQLQEQVTQLQERVTQLTL